MKKIERERGRGIYLHYTM